MLGLFGVIRDNLKLKLNRICIDNWVFKLHYRVTTVIFCVATLLVTSREYIGEHIKCINDMNDAGFDRVIETFCFFTTTFTVVDEESTDFLRNGYGYYGHHGILPFGIGSKQPIKKHTYYQWVPFFLFGQAIMFYLTHLLWKKLEDNRIHKLVAGLDNSRFAILEKEIEVDDHVIPTRQKREDCIKRIKSVFLEHIKLNKSWTRWLIFCEILNVLHVIFQFYITHKFLGSQFITLGSNLIHQGPKILEKVFPKVTKCTFHTYGPSGSIQVHDALCILAVNIVNEKIYVFLWFWFVILFSVSCLTLVWRLSSRLLYSRCLAFNQFIFGHGARGRLYPWHIQLVVKHCSYHDWLLLKYLAKNMDGVSFKQLFMNISEDLEDRKPLF